MRKGLAAAGEVAQLGLEILGLNILAIKPTPETARALEAETRKALVALAASNAKTEADARAYAVSASMQAISTVDARVLQALASVGMKPEQLLAVAFQELAGRADKIGELNISPDLLRELLNNK